PPDIAERLASLRRPPAHTRRQPGDGGTRRSIEVAAPGRSRPRVLLLDEPAAGLSHAEHLGLGDCIRELPERYGISVLLVEQVTHMALGIATEAMVVSSGRVSYHGAAQALRASPDTLHAADLGG